MSTLRGLRAVIVGEALSLFLGVSWLEDADAVCCKNFKGSIDRTSELSQSILLEEKGEMKAKVLTVLTFILVLSANTTIVFPTA
jgi:hypothetical protein